jgi:predicted transcriptional regulator
MRTTIKLDDEAGEIVQLYADSRAISISKAISELVLQATKPRTWIKYVDGIPVFDIPQGRTITQEEIRAALTEEF